MKSYRKITTMAIVVSLVLLGGVGVSLYKQDSKTAPQTKGPSKGAAMGQQAKVVRAYIVNFCMEYSRYPSKKEFAKRYPKVAADPEWSYSPGEDLKSGTFKYPTPLFSAPGRFHTETNPCKVFNTEVF